MLMLVPHRAFGRLLAHIVELFSLVSLLERHFEPSTWLLTADDAQFTLEATLLKRLDPSCQVKQPSQISSVYNKSVNFLCVFLPPSLLPLLIYVWKRQVTSKGAHRCHSEELSLGASSEMLVTMTSTVLLLGESLRLPTVNIHPHPLVVNGGSTAEFLGILKQKPLLYWIVSVPCFSFRAYRVLTIFAIICLRGHRKWWLCPLVLFCIKLIFGTA